MTSMCSSSRKSHAVLNGTNGYFHRPSPYAYQSDYYLMPRSIRSKVLIARINDNATWRLSNAMLIISSTLVLIAVLAIAGSVLWMVFRTDSKNAVVGFSCSFRIIKGEKYNPLLKLSTSMIFREKERKFQNLLELLFRRSVLGSSYKRTAIDKFENGALKIFFRLYLYRRRISRSIMNVEDTIADIIIKETYSVSSLFKNMEIDLKSVSVKRINKEERENTDIMNQKQEQQKHAMITKNGLLRPNKTSIMNSKLITHAVRPIKADFNEPDIDFTNIPTVKATFRATKINITAYNSTKGTEPMLDIEDTTRKMFSQNEQITRSNQTSNFVKYSLTEKLSTTVMFNEEENLNEKREYEVQTITTQSILDIFKDFHNPDVTNSPWKPIVPGYSNTEFKLLFDDNIEKTDHIKSRTRESVSLTSDSGNNIKQIDDTTSSVILGSVNFHDINIFSTEIPSFPRDRIIPDLTIFTPNDHDKPDIEVAGELPSETYNIKLKISPEYDKKTTSNSMMSESSINRNISESVSIKDNTSNVSRKTEEKFDSSISTIEPDDNIESHRSETKPSKSPIYGVGIAKPLSDTEIKLEMKRRYGNNLTSSINENLQNRRVNVDSQPIYTSYNTSNLNGGGFGSSLIENSATLKPFRHTIPVDKITSIVNYDNVSFHYPSDLALSNDEIDVKSNVSQDKIVTPDSKKIMQEESFVTEHYDTIKFQLSNYEQIISTDPSIVQNKEDNKISHLNNTTENDSIVHKKVIAENSDAKENVSRNLTFIEI